MVMQRRVGGKMVGSRVEEMLTIGDEFNIDMHRL